MTTSDKPKDFKWTDPSTEGTCVLNITTVVKDPNNIWLLKKIDADQYGSPSITLGPEAYWISKPVQKDPLERIFLVHFNLPKKPTVVTEQHKPAAAPIVKIIGATSAPPGQSAGLENPSAKIFIGKLVGTTPAPSGQSTGLESPSAKIFIGKLLESHDNDDSISGRESDRIKIYQDRLDLLGQHLDSPSIDRKAIGSPPPTDFGVIPIDRDRDTRAARHIIASATQQVLHAAANPNQDVHWKHQCRAIIDDALVLIGKTDSTSENSNSLGGY